LVKPKSEIQKFIFPPGPPPWNPLKQTQLVGNLDIAKFRSWNFLVSDSKGGVREGKCFKLSLKNVFQNFIFKIFGIYFQNFKSRFCSNLSKSSNLLKIEKCQNEYFLARYGCCGKMHIMVQIFQTRNFFLKNSSRHKTLTGVSP